MPRPKPLVLIILDGWGYSPKTEANAIALARKPTYDRMLREYPNTLIIPAGLSSDCPKAKWATAKSGTSTLVRAELSIWISPALI
jgi:2,3-bisphosphoglycerate-independent phosphoglycerate mutase